MLLRQDNQTMIPKIASFLGSIQNEGNVMFAVAAVVSATVPSSSSSSSSSARSFRV